MNWCTVNPSQPFNLGTSLKNLVGPLPIIPNQLGTFRMILQSQLGPCFSDHKWQKNCLSMRHRLHPSQLFNLGTSLGT